MKGAEGEALSGLQQLKLKQIDKKARGKEPKGFKAKKPMGQQRQAPPRAREDVIETPPPPEPPKPAKTRPALVPAAGLAGTGNVTALRRAKPRLTVIQGGAKKTEN
ncbi:MAG: hypothetical protein KJ833_02805 [Alphaproteobacteria bacterium]|nr:hypothetical protein [Alphaproteobacteria bacterium]